MNGVLSGVAIGYGASMLNCSNYGTLTCLEGGIIDICGIYYNPAPDKMAFIEIDSCKNYGEINISSDHEINSFSIAGIANLNNNVSKVSGCINKGNITVSGSLVVKSSGYYFKIAGISLGNAYYVSNCINDGDITLNTHWEESNKSHVAMSGISMGNVISKIINCANYGDLNGESVVGIGNSTGGSNIGGSYNKIEICNCYNSGNITSSGGQHAYGIGEDAIIKNSYNLGSISGIETGTGNAIGGGDDTTVDSNTCHALTGNETETEKSSLKTALNNAIETDEETPWSQWDINPNINNGYPVFSWQIAEE